MRNIRSPHKKHLRRYIQNEVNSTDASTVCTDGGQADVAPRHRHGGQTSGDDTEGGLASQHMPTPTQTSRKGEKSLPLLHLPTPA